MFFKANFSLSLKKYLLQKEHFLISLVGIHLIALQDWSYYSFSLFQTKVFQDLQHLTFFSTLIMRERAALKMHHSLKNIRMSRYRNGAVFNFKLKFMMMNWGLSILYLSNLKKEIYITAPILKLATAVSGCQLLISLVSGIPTLSLPRIWGSLAFVAKHALADVPSASELPGFKAPIPRESPSDFL